MNSTSTELLDEPTIAVTVAVPITSPDVNVTVAVPDTSVVAVMGLTYPSVVAKVTTAPASDSSALMTVAVIVLVLVPSANISIGLAPTVNVSGTMTSTSHVYTCLNAPSSKGL